MSDYNNLHANLAQLGMLQNQMGAIQGGLVQQALPGTYLSFGQMPYDQYTPNKPPTVHRVGPPKRPIESLREELRDWHGSPFA